MTGSPGSNAPAAPPRTAIAILAACLIIVMIGFGIAIPLMPSYITHFGASGAALGLVMAVYSFMQLLFAPFWGRRSDRYGRKPILLLGVIGYAVTFLLQGLAQNLFEFTLIRALFAIMALAASRSALIAGALVMNGGNVLLQPSVTSLVSKRAKTGQGAAMGLTNSFQSLGRAVGPLWAGFAYDITNTLSFWTGAAVQLIALLYGMRALKREVEAQPPPVVVAGE